MLACTEAGVVERTLLVFAHALEDDGLSRCGLYVLKSERTSLSLEAEETMRRPRPIWS